MNQHEIAREAIRTLSDLYYENGPDAIRANRAINILTAYIAANVRVAPSDKDAMEGVACDWDEDGNCRCVRVAPSHPSPGESAGFDAEVARVAAFLHDEYGCRITCRGGRLADDRHPSHNEAYRDQAERLVAAIGDEHE